MQLEHEENNQRFVVRLPDGEAELGYAAQGADVLNLHHTFVPDSARGQGVGDVLVSGALDYARQHGKRIIPTCPYVAAWMQKHPEQNDLVAPGSA
jgi:predicted GNAT family acetyltransferase